MFAISPNSWELWLRFLLTSDSSEGDFGTIRTTLLLLLDRRTQETLVPNSSRPMDKVPSAGLRPARFHGQPFFLVEP
jgi:hypothetical protein